MFGFTKKIKIDTHRHPHLRAMELILESVRTQAVVSIRFDTARLVVILVDKYGATVDRLETSVMYSGSIDGLSWYVRVPNSF